MVTAGTVSGPEVRSYGARPCALPCQCGRKATAIDSEPEATIASASVRAVGRAERERLRRVRRTAGQVMARRWVGVPAGFKTPATVAPDTKAEGRSEPEPSHHAGRNTHPPQRAPTTDPATTDPPNPREPRGTPTAA
ncbi:hypothetical protein GCM10010140_39890 [Streptosporangium pseudovulgare]|uniref:Uncharacterized protein n=1 Tax=Streptosporangium pseudovulgare TaxID=35765 RepID=A0ABQ2QZP9_9ACTN|nr:hypothetical protein GCM10010140_39890 [Streptosporangium pseudovulgare]